ncbi:DEAD/DEAH box helicase [Ralstonia pseudosolanacearum]|uniref:DEAD/DEAH box helicase n=1 Tax=Ralstonia pseudosolanacearum TaxID=1310165 RepID=UPI001402FD7E|nr:DEAD/DEAH box helicase [Ralstonia pseudosolanacearum]KAF3462129.1 DEAD/DEAH box helicase [Ralstonia solanacearum]NKA78165.1 DEAD/DEAH box helicase [Ralstonia solanacearum]NKG01216.1 DEAD/DEAH box helicase [Ralstonia solanacearum]NKG06105.1 DEAD/DEAH box helicase [Ralstonia solanacearum]UNJ29760.1 DEAD/DEAH box helicase [Ralstonia pseudosolanacearum]
MDVLGTHARVVEDYAKYIRSFLNIADPSIEKKVEEKLSEGRLWPEPLLQFNPAFASAGTVAEVATNGVVHQDLASIFKGYSLYRHQIDAIQLGTADRDFIVTSGTGSGKSLTYIATIFHDLLTKPPSAGIRAVIVYPMNALINSQYEEFRRYRENFEKATGQTFPIEFGQYTGQEKDEVRQRMREHPPHVLLTNYMMLELLLTRTAERTIRDSIYENLKFLVFDELHTYRGRQGADVAMLIRRIQAQCTQRLVCIGTSATMASGTDPALQRQQISDVATVLFGRPFKAEQVVSESLARSLADGEEMPDANALRAAIQAGIDVDAGLASLKTNALGKWLENRIALNVTPAGLVRGKPLPLSAVVRQLVADAQVDEAIALNALNELLRWISQINLKLQAEGQRYTVLPFKLHQFISQTGSVYTTLDQDENRFITLEPGVYKTDEETKKPIFPNVFSRSSGHAFICVTRVGDHLEPREFREASDEEDGGHDGYLIVGDDIWDEREDLAFLPDTWLNKTRTGPDSRKRPFFPVRLYFDETGRCSETEPLKGCGWFMKAPLLFDPTAGVFFDTKTNEGTKLTKLGSEGRSTSTTITTFSILNRLSDAGFAARDQKLISFTDNRQDAALQAGHFNDFVQVVRLRAGIQRAISTAGAAGLTFERLGQAVFDALKLPFIEYANKNDEPELPNIRRGYDELFQTFLLYRALGDLRRSWRIVLPNLEQCALLDVDYSDLSEVAAQHKYWENVPVVDQLSIEDRILFLTAILDFFRLEYALHSENYLTQSKLREFEKLFREKLRAPWTLDPNENLREPFYMRLDSLHRTSKVSSKSMGPASGLGKFIKLFVKQRELSVDLRGDHYRDFIELLLKKLEGADYLASQAAKGEKNDNVTLYRLRIEKIVWRPGDLKRVKADLIKRRSYKQQAPKPNLFFQDLYQRDFAAAKRLRAEDHTGQLNVDERRDREERFRAEWFLDADKTLPDLNRIRTQSISALFCSPTMELGIDIGGLSVVHLRNAPPNPANYAQRAGRSGRGGQGALVFTYCSTYSPHDRHYFSQQTDLVAGIVQAPRLDLANRELLQTHLNALAISEVGLPGLENNEGGRPSVTRFIDEDDHELPLLPSVRSGLTLGATTRDRIRAAFQRAIKDFEPSLKEPTSHWFTDAWIDRTLQALPDNLHQSVERWRSLYRSARSTLEKATQMIQSGTLSLGSDEYRKYKRSQDQATRQLDLLRNQGGGSSELSEFYPYRYLASEGFLPGYNFTRLPLRVFLPTADTHGEFISRPRVMALREFGPLNIIYHSGRKYQVRQLVVQEPDAALTEAKISTKAGYFLVGDQLQLETCPLSGVSLSDNANRQHLHNLLEMTESRADEIDRISCEEEERASRGFSIQTYFSIDGGDMERVQRARLRVGGDALLNLMFVPAARLVHVNEKWRAQNIDGFPMGMVSGEWRGTMPDPSESQREDFRRVKFWTSNLADALYIVPVQPLGLEADGVITLQYALKRAIEQIFQVESNEIGVMAVGDKKAPNILLYESAEGSLGILSRFVEDASAFQFVVEAAQALCRFNDLEYKGPASYDDLLSYYNQRDHQVIDRHLIKDALAKLAVCELEIQTNKDYASYEDHYASLLKQLDPSSPTERKFIEYLHANGLRLPDAAQKRVDGLYVQPDFYYHPRIWVFCDGTPHDDPTVQADDAAKRQAILGRGDEVWVYYYKDNLAAKVAERPDIFKKVK